MATDVLMPQMGESVAEGTVVRWIKKVGDRVDRDEPLFEISTDKVDAEIPAPAAGVLTEIRVQEGETVPIDAVVAVISDEAAPPQKVAAPVTPAPAPVREKSPAQPPSPASAAPAAQQAPEPPQERARTSPLVRRMAKDQQIDLSGIHGTGIGGRVTKDDLLAFMASRQQPQQASGAPPSSPAAAQPASKRGGAVALRPEPGRVEPMSVMRKKIAEHMVLSRRTSAHVHSVFEVNYSRVAHIREMKKREYEDAGVKLTYLSFIVKAIVDALRAVPVVNASISGDDVVYHKDVNVGIAVALDWGLIVPVVKQADEKNLLGLSRAIADLAGRARARQLTPDEVAGGTFTITNPGVFGALLGMPIINQPQVAILGVGNIEKRPVVIDDAIAIRPMGYLTLGYDHRLIDGAVADRFMSHVKSAIENWDPVDA